MTAVSPLYSNYATLKKTRPGLRPIDKVKAGANRNRVSPLSSSPTVPFLAYYPLPLNKERGLGSGAVRLDRPRTVGMRTIRNLL
jgi:hypothetical protein